MRPAYPCDLRDFFGQGQGSYNLFKRNSLCNKEVDSGLHASCKANRTDIIQE